MKRLVLLFLILLFCNQYSWANNFECIVCKITHSHIAVKPTSPVAKYSAPEYASSANHNYIFYLDNANKKVLDNDKMVMDTYIFNNNEASAKIENPDIGLYNLHVDRITGDIKITLDNYKVGYIQTWTGTCNKQDAPKF